MTHEEKTTVAQTKAPAEKEIKETTVTKDFTIELTSDELKLKARELQTYRKDMSKAEDDFEEKKQAHKATITRLENTITRTISVLAEGKELRQVECTMFSDFNQKLVRFIWGDKVMEERPMTVDELQMEMGPVLVGRDVAQEHLVFTPSNEENSVASVIREETNRHTKHSSVDGPTE